MVDTILRHTAPQTVRTRKPQPRNNAGGPTHVIDMWSRLNRFLILGTEGGTYYVGEKEHTLSNVKVVRECLDADPIRTVNTIRTISEQGRAPKNDYAIYALAMAASHPKASRLALANLLAVCRTGTHLFQFVKSVDSLRGWGPALRRAVANWYLVKSPDQLAYQVLKYQQREGWSHRDVIRKAHPQTDRPMTNAVFKYIVKGEVSTDTPEIVQAVEASKGAYASEKNIDFVVSMIEQYNLSREMVPTEVLTNREVLTALSKQMPYTAFMRNLGNLTRHGVFEANPEMIREKSQFLTNEGIIRKARVHPLSILTALRTYAQGQGFRGSNEWRPIPQFKAALDNAFYLAFNNVAPTGLNFRVGVDVSGSMSSQINNGVLTSTEVAAALSLVLVKTEPWVDVQGFNSGLTPLNFAPTNTLEDAMHKARGINYGGTDAALIIDDATARGLDVDVFVVITDNETWVRSRKPSDALRDYRRKMNKPNAKLVVLATDATNFSIADPNDPGMLDIAGFDTAVPEIIREFALGNL